MTRYEEIVRLWQGFEKNTADDLDRCLDSFRILFAYNSAKIENVHVSYHDTQEVFEDGVVRNFQGAPRTLFEIQNQKLCYAMLLPKIVAKEPLSIELLKDVHGALTAGTYDERRFVTKGERPGQFKKHDHVTGINEVGSYPEDVEQDVRDLLEEVQAEKPAEPSKILTAAAYFHARFEHIHPFADGNGRVGRTLLNYYLMVYEHPPLVVYDDNRSDYYAALQTFDAKEEIEQLVRFLQYQVERTWEKAFHRHTKKD